MKLTYDQIEKIIHSSWKSVYRTKQVPLDMDFIKQAYVLLNEHIFENKLPNDLILKSISSQRKNHYFGRYRPGYNVISLFRRKVVFDRHIIEINNVFMMPLYHWLHILIHECIHVLDYAINIDNHVYNKKLKRHIADPHGRFFEDMCKTLMQKGFPYVGCFSEFNRLSYNKNDRNGKKYIEENKQFRVVCFDTINDDMDENECIKINKQYIKHFVRNLKICKKKSIVNTTKIDIYSLNRTNSWIFRRLINQTSYNKKSNTFDLDTYSHNLFFELMGKDFLKHRRTVRID